MEVEVSPCSAARAPLLRTPARRTPTFKAELYPRVPSFTIACHLKIR